MSALFIPEVRRRLVMRGTHLVSKALVIVFKGVYVFKLHNIPKNVGLQNKPKWEMATQYVKIVTFFHSSFFVVVVFFVFVFYLRNIYSTHSFPNGFYNENKCLASCCEDKKNHNTQRCQSFPLGCVINVVFTRQILNGESPSSTTSLRYD